MNAKNNGRFDFFTNILQFFLFSLLTASRSVSAEDIQFNTDMMDVKDRENINIEQFSRRGFIMPGTYQMAIMLNRQDLAEQEITFYPPDNNPAGSDACLTRKDVAAFAIKAELQRKLTWWHQGQCLDISSVAGMEVHGDLGYALLTVKIPETWLEYRSPNWDPPSRWDDGIPGALLDYNLNLQALEQYQYGSKGYNFSSSGVTGVNLDAWRLRADWQGSAVHTAGSGESTQQSFDWSRYYAWRAVPALHARLTLGEDYLNSAIFDSFRFAGASLNSDDSMLPPGLRGYAPEISGVARTNAKVVVSQQERVLYETQVPAGPFRIQDLSDAVAGKLDVRIEEQDGAVQHFQVDTATIPYLTRPGMVRYKLAAGKPAVGSHQLADPSFATGEFSWGVANGWSAYGGSILGGDYNAFSAGMGRDLFALGAISLDTTLSRAVLPGDEMLTGNSWRLSYSKRFDELASQITFAGYRFSDRNFMTVPDYLDAVATGAPANKSKQLYTVTFNQQLPEWGIGAYLNYSHQTWWDRSASDRYDITLSRYFDLGGWKNINASLAAYRNKFRESNDDGGWLSVSLPFGSQSTLSYNLSSRNQRYEQTVGYFKHLDEQNKYQLTAGTSREGGMASGFYFHETDSAQLNANASYQHGRYASAGLSAQGGATLTPQGGALHRTSIAGGTRLLVDSDGVAGVPVRGYGNPTKTNTFGKAVISDVNSYYRNSARIDVEALSDNVEASRSVVQATLTEGAIGYRKFNVIAGEKAMANIRLEGGDSPPFGALVRNEKKQQTGMIGDDGSVWLSGIRAGEKMSVEWGKDARCYVEMPAELPPPPLSELLLPCRA
ncbi:outer membrane usher protein [Erwiniaceae bacterium BAC15a-03b]|uniref:Outer membrane usher protein n=1 Tax=Winslowiella arboricola TaxID=2978220 RepID=A0A9J6PJH4_9GAMM|nr:outer membrane usher protein [Winslowiella arboricola]MCU5771611.1 outer membrane usher protein [Winslowiella arboricola]MCU5775917.1 outer membrane usher protein [Winslowiella arboricola]